MSCYPGQPMEREGADPFSDPELEDDSSFLKPHSTQSTIKWLQETYHYEDSVCLPRSTIYEHYIDFCHRQQLQPVNAASFGKIIRQQFPQLTTRRLGTRGQSKYHYYGLGIKPTSRYYTEEYVLKQQNQGVSRKEPESKKLHTFMVMYRAHCQRILDSVVRANFSEVENFLLHFWQGMPTHLLLVLSSDLVVDLVAHCDSMLYTVLSDVLIVSPLQTFPESLAQEVLNFSTNLRKWLETAMNGLPDTLKETKYRVADMFTRSLKRQTSLMHLAQAARNALRSDDSLLQLRKDWESLDLHTVFAHTLYAVQPLDIPEEYITMVPEFVHEFASIVEEKSTIEDFVVWIEQLMETCVTKDCGRGEVSLRQVGQTFLLTWNFFTSKIVREFTLQSAPSFGTFHLLHMLVDDYIIHCLESRMEREQQKSYSRKINVLKQEENAKDIQTEDQYPSGLEHPGASGDTVADNAPHLFPTTRTAQFSLLEDQPVQIQHQEQDALALVAGRRFDGLPMPASTSSQSGVAISSTSLASLGGMPLGSITSPPSSASSSSSIAGHQQPLVGSLADLLPRGPGISHGGFAVVAGLGANVSRSEPRASEGTTSRLPQMPILSQALSNTQQPHIPLQHAPLPSFIPQNLTLRSHPASTIGAGSTVAALAAAAPLHNLQSSQTCLNPLNPSQMVSATANIPGLPSFQMPLTHTFGASLPGQMSHTGALPLLPTMYPYPAYPSLPAVPNLSVPSQPISSSIVHVSTPGFPTQTLVSGYSSYASPSVYDNVPVSTVDYSS